MEQLGFGVYDAFHLSCAEMAEADVFLTTDDRLLRRAQRYQDRINVLVENPMTWLMTTLQGESQEEDVYDNDAY